MDGADAVMLSGETSVGMDPLNVIEHMTKIIASVEDSPLITVPIKPPHVKTVRYISKSICYHAANMANDIDAKVISTLTNSGYTAFQVSAWRPKAYILAFTSNKRILTMLNLLWGVEAFYYSNLVNTDTTIKEINQLAIDKGFLEKNDYAINLTSMPVKEKGMVNTLRLTQL
jgi:pyruvate kinase